ncbi:MAG: HU family DNA-binding protein [Candidatus Cloacimonadota bacterium]|nr:HU family DNA-binding protein [Candidatus Cloacimonadota bacterium]
MTKADLVKKISDDTGILRKDVAIVVDGFLGSVQETMQNGNHIEIRGFGTYKLKVRKARTGRNPKTNEEVPVPKRIVPVFKFSPAFKKAVSTSNDNLLK